MLRVTEAEYLSGYQVRLVFSDGAAGVANLEGLLEGPIFQPLKEEEAFRKFELTDHTLSWPNGADFAPEYLRGLVVENSRSVHANSN